MSCMVNPYRFATLAAPTIAAVTPVTSPPSFTIGLPTGTTPGDTFHLVLYSDSGHTTIAYGPFTRVLTSGDISGGFSIITSTIGAGTYYPGAWVTHSGVDGLKGYGTSFTVSSLLVDLLGYWKLNDGSGTSAADEIGAKNLTLVGTPTWGTGKLGGCLTLNGTSQYGKISQVTQVGKGALSIAAWFKTTSSAAGSHIVLIIGDDTGVNAGQAVSISIEAGVPWARCNSGNTAHGGSGYNDGNWHLVVLTKTASGTVANIALWVDGVSQTMTSSGSTVIDLASTGMCLGAINPDVTPTSFFGGSVDAVGVWGKVLSSTEIASLYNSGTGLEYPFS